MTNCRCAVPLKDYAHDKKSVSEKPSLIDYLKSVHLDPAIEQLVTTGIANYQREPLRSQRLMATQTQAGAGGREKGWIEATFGKKETEILESLSALDGPPTWSLAEIESAFNEAIKGLASGPAAALPTFTLVKGISVSYLHEYPLGRDSVVQLASQFNFLESPSTHRVPVSDYLSDPTQGPRGSMEAAAAALHRTAAELRGRLPNALFDVLEGDVSLFYRNGYLEPRKLAPEGLKTVNALVKKNLQRMTILPQWVRCEATGAVQLQVFAAAPSFQGQPQPGIGSLEAQLCDTLVTAQYRAIAQLAVIRSIKSGATVPLHLTLVGQGVFNNPPSVLKNAFVEVAKVVKSFPNVKVFIHAYNDDAQTKTRNALDPSTWHLIEWTSDQFKNALR